MKNTKNVKANENAKVNTTAKSTEKKVDLTAESKVTLVGNLRTLLPEVIKLDDALGAKIDKALKSKKTSVETLKDLLTQSIALGKINSKPVVENEEKKKIVAKKNDKATAKTATTAPKADSKKSPVQSVKTTGDTKAPIATIFPDTITTKIEDEDIVLTKAKSTEFHTVQDIVEAMENNIVIIACYWTPRHIKQYGYSASFRLEKEPKAFKDDLDLAMAAFDCPTIKRLWAMSVETEAVYCFDEEDLTPVEDTNPYNGDKYLIRVSNGMEFEIYTAEVPKD